MGGSQWTPAAHPHAALLPKDIPLASLLCLTHTVLLETAPFFLELGALSSPAPGPPGVTRSRYVQLLGGLSDHTALV